MSAIPSKRKGQSAAAEAYDPAFLDSATFSRAKYSQDWLIRSVLLSGQPGVLGGPKKTLKTSLAVDMAVSIGSGKHFLDHFPVPRARAVAIISGESGQAALQDIARRVAAARQVDLRRGCDVRWSFRLPRLASPDDRMALRRSLRAAHIEVAIIDPLYLCLLEGVKGMSASNLYEIGPLLRRAGDACLAAGATPVVVHHSRKSAGRPTAGAPDPPDLDDLAFAGIGEYARQWILLGRREPYEPGSGHHDLVMSVGGSAGHSGLWHLDVNEGVTDSRLAGRGWSVKVSDAAAFRPEHHAGRTPGMPGPTKHGGVNIDLG
jgi:replicative DNA helicase